MYQIYQKKEKKEEGSEQFTCTCKSMYVNVKEIEGTNILQTILKEKIKRKKVAYILKQYENTNAS